MLFPRKSLEEGAHDTSGHALVIVNEVLNGGMSFVSKRLRRVGEVKGNRLSDERSQFDRESSENWRQWESGSLVKLFHERWIDEHRAESLPNILMRKTK